MSLSVQNNTRPPLKDRLIPWYFVIAFVVLFVVDGIFVYIATKSNSGVVTEHPYKKGLAYNQTIQLAEQQEALGWHATTTYKNEALTFKLIDKQDLPIQHATVIAYIERPLEDGYKKELTLTEVENGIYSAPISLPLKGQWNVTIGVSWESQQYQITKRLVVK